MKEQISTEVEGSKASRTCSRKTQWWILVGLSVYLLLTGLNSLLALVLGILGDGWGGSLEVQERIMLLILGANFPLTLVALVLCGMGLRKPPMKTRLVLCLFGWGIACVVLSIVGDVLFGIDLY